MKQDLALKLLDRIMKWDDGRARQEFGWLSLMARLKYDGYRDFVAGARFIESLADWLQQFQQHEREPAYSFIRHYLVYLGPAEIKKLVEAFFPETVQRRAMATVATERQIQPYQVLSNEDAAHDLERLLRQTLFLGLSDGARLDTFRRANAGVVNNEQVVVQHQINPEKWKSLLSDLRADTKDPSARFRILYLIDDFVGSGITFLRREADGWMGKMAKFWNETATIRDKCFTTDWTLCVHHYVASHRASQHLEKAHAAAQVERSDDWFADAHFTYGTILPATLPIDEAQLPDFMRLTERYYDPSIETDSTKRGGTDMRLGFARCALPLVLEHNTPNNSVALLWAESTGENGCHAMRPLFRRRDRHSK
jgi:hypothetical protein